jgi:hypothetical protein
VILQQALDAAQLHRAETEILRQSDRLQPKLGRLLVAIHMLITREALAANIGPITSSRASTWSTDCQLDRLADAAEHFHKRINGELGRFPVHHVGHTRAAAWPTRGDREPD